MPPISHLRCRLTNPPDNFWLADRIICMHQLEWRTIGNFEKLRGFKGSEAVAELMALKSHNFDLGFMIGIDEDYA